MKNPVINNGKWALIIDGGQLLEIKPLRTNGTVFDYAKQLLVNNIIPEFRIYDRIDVIFDSDQSQIVKSFIRRHGYENKKQQP
jgi:peptidoglycan hydrolase-like protein with peptidoglycan-binding domain